MLSLFVRSSVSTSRLASRRSHLCVSFSSQAAVENQPKVSDKIDVKKVENLLAEVLALNVIESIHLAKLVRKELDIPEVKDTLFARLLGSAPSVSQSAGAGTSKVEEKAAEAAPVVAQKVSFNLKLESFAAGDKIKIIKLVREMGGLGLKEAKEKVESTPTVLMKDLIKGDADSWLEKLKAAGGKGVLE